MKKITTTALVLFFGISFAMSQNIHQQRQLEEQRRHQQQQQQAQQQRTLQQEREREAELRRREANSHRVTFNSAGGDAVAPQLVYRGDKATRPTAPSRANHAFVEWRRDGEPFDFSMPITAPITLTAVWTNLNPTITTTSEGILLQGSTLTNKLDWLVRNVESHNTYIIEVNANQTIAPRTLYYRGAINVTIILRGDDVNRTLRLSSHGTMFTVNQNVTFILGNNITLHGHAGNTAAMVQVNGGNFRMNTGATITGNINEGHGWGRRAGGGVSVASGTFQMNGGTISNNVASQGGGVSGTFTMSGGVIYGNRAWYGGGVSGAVTMTGGIIFENSATANGGGVNGGLTMRGGTITSNTAGQHGGGVFIPQGTPFTKTNGTITGFSDDPNNGNVVRDHDGVLARRGHAVYASVFLMCQATRNWIRQFRRERTAGVAVNLNTQYTTNWEQ